MLKLTCNFYAICIVIYLVQLQMNVGQISKLLNRRQSNTADIPNIKRVVSEEHIDIRMPTGSGGNSNFAPPPPRGA